MRYLIFNAHWLGDALFSTPAIRAVKKHDPASYVACLVPERCVPVLKNNPHIDELIIFSDKVLFFGFWRFIALVLELRKKRFETAIFLERSKTKAFVAFLAGIPKRVGYAQRGKLRTLTVNVPSNEANLHRADHFLRLVTSLGIKPDGKEPDFLPSKDSVIGWQEKKRRYALEPKKYIVLHAGGNWDLKRWSAEHFTQLIRCFVDHSNYKIVLCGTESEKALTQTISSSFESERVLSLAGETSLDELALLLNEAALLISNDSGPIHLAASQQVAILGLFGPTRPDLTGPIARGNAKILHKDAGCELPCYFKECDYRVCLDWLTPEEVFKEAGILLSA